MNCTYKHTTYQPEDSEWACPKCGAKCEDGDFVVDTSPDEEGNCILLHDRDELRCFKCDHSISGKAWANRLQKKKNLVECPCCKGKGLVSGTKEEVAV